MRCYKCGSFLTDGDTCPQCGENVRIYKKTARVSDAYYNAGLYKARVRDLTGAVESLKISLMINKYNTNARNLLGLVYCEMGDVVEALSQWVVSKNFTPEGNIAGHYIKKIQTNQNRFEMITGTIRKYNLSLKYAKEGNLDMAVIQLKKVVANNPQLIKAHLLLALIYIKQDELSRAKKLLNAVLAIDKNNTLAHIYQKEIAERNAAKKAETSGSFLPKRKLFICHIAWYIICFSIFTTRCTFSRHSKIIFKVWAGTPTAVRMERRSCHTNFILTHREMLPVHRTTKAACKTI